MKNKNELINEIVEVINNKLVQKELDDEEIEAIAVILSRPLETARNRAILKLKFFQNEEGNNKWLNLQYPADQYRQ